MFSQYPESSWYRFAPSHSTDLYHEKYVHSTDLYHENLHGADLYHEDTASCGASNAPAAVSKPHLSPAGGWGKVRERRATGGRFICHTLYGSLENNSLNLQVEKIIPETRQTRGAGGLAAISCPSFCDCRGVKPRQGKLRRLIGALDRSFSP